MNIADYVSIFIAIVSLYIAIMTHKMSLFSQTETSERASPSKKFLRSLRKSEYENIMHSFNEIETYYADIPIIVIV